MPGVATAPRSGSPWLTVAAPSPPASPAPARCAAPCPLLASTGRCSLQQPPRCVGCGYGEDGPPPHRASALTQPTAACALPLAPVGLLRRCRRASRSAETKQLLNMVRNEVLFPFTHVEALSGDAPFGGRYAARGDRTVPRTHQPGIDAALHAPRRRAAARQARRGR